MAIAGIEDHSERFGDVGVACDCVTCKGAPEPRDTPPILRDVWAAFLAAAGGRDASGRVVWVSICHFFARLSARRRNPLGTRWLGRLGLPRSGGDSPSNLRKPFGLFRSAEVHPETRHKFLVLLLRIVDFGEIGV